MADVGPAVTIKYDGILPDLFREGQGIVAQGVLVDANHIEAHEVLAKHDEEYMPPEVAEAMQKTHAPLQYTDEQLQGSTIMIAEIGNFSLIVALGLSILVSIYPLYGASVGNQALMRMARPLTYGIFGMILWCHSSSLAGHFTPTISPWFMLPVTRTPMLPWYYRLSAVWGGHEGSLLLWVLIQAGWAVAVAVFSRGMPLESLARVLSVMGMIAIGFLLFIIATSNPFLRTLAFLPC